MKRRLKIISLVSITFVFVISLFCVFFDEAVLVRKGTIFRVSGNDKVVALTFDDGPSPAWTPLILDELKKANIKATFFMLGQHVEKYPEVARRVAQEGHEIGNHTYDHHVLIYYKPEEIVKEVKSAEKIIFETTGVLTKYIRPPKAWITAKERKMIEKLGYKVVLWSLNSKDWVNFDAKYIVRYIAHRVKSGDIILFHDSGGVFRIEGGDRSETVKSIALLAEALNQKGYKFVTLTELLERESKWSK